MLNSGEVCHVPIDAHAAVSIRKFAAVLERCRQTVMLLNIPPPVLYIGDSDVTHQPGAGWDHLQCSFHLLDNILKALLAGEQLMVTGQLVGLEQLQQPTVNAIIRCEL